ncbi:hypothetical protein KFK09_013185 [Dendrobium nobile]|uniref:Uncharacterized protein n=1 Tax=Dendrobium nobile TaxID=94219 RepID=A0A8T3B6Q1_DENNO|nr:hypothetical protein KFK09_013185 [Dendrobium nobile]
MRENLLGLGCPEQIDEHFKKSFQILNFSIVLATWCRRKMELDDQLVKRLNM